MDSEIVSEGSDFDKESTAVAVSMSIMSGCIANLVFIFTPHPVLKFRSVAGN